MANAQYMQDYDGIYCPANQDYINGKGTPPPNQGYNRYTVPSFIDLLQPYIIKNTQIFRCPSIKRGVPLARPEGTTGSTAGVDNRMWISERRMAYGVNMGTGSSNECDGPGRSYRNYRAGNPLNSGWRDCSPVKDSAVMDPARTIYAADSYGSSSNPGKGSVWIYYKDDPDDLRTHHRHLKTANILFCDGHVKALTKEATLQQKWTIN